MTELLIILLIIMLAMTIDRIYLSRKNKKKTLRDAYKLHVPVIDNPLKPGGKNTIPTVLRQLASQENCDGVPYDQMMIAADYILELEDKLTKMEENY